MISGFIQSLLINYGLRHSSTIGNAFEGALTTSSACFFTSTVLLACYFLSEKSYRLIRASLFVSFFHQFNFEYFNENILIFLLYNILLFLNYFLKKPFFLPSSLLLSLLLKFSFPHFLGSNIQQSVLLLLLEFRFIPGSFNKNVPYGSVLRDARIRSLSRNDSSLRKFQLRIIITYFLNCRREIFPEVLL